MSRPFLTRAPTTSELTLLSKFLGSYRDGSGNQREEDGSSRADSRQIERCFAELLHGKTTENKSFYDFALEFSEGGGIVIRAVSVKSKQIDKLRDYADLAKRVKMRAHFEVSNSASKDWKLCQEHGLTEDLFRTHQRAEDFGTVILQRQNEDRIKSEAAYIKKYGGNRTFLPEQCVFISVLYSPMEKGERSWLVSTYPVLLPPPAKWAFRGGSSVVGYDAEGGVLYEWYALSGSQFKYYPLLSDRLYGTDLFEVPAPASESLRAKASRLFGD